MSKKDMGFELANANTNANSEVVHTFVSVIDKMKSSNVPETAIQKVERIREITKQSKATTFELMKNLHDIFDNENLLKAMGYRKGEFCLMCSQLFGLPKEISSKYANSGAFVVENNGMYVTPFAETDSLGFVTDITPTALIEMTFPKKYNDKGISLDVFSNFWNAYIAKCGKMPTTKQIREFKKAVLQLLDENEHVLENGFDSVVALLEMPKTDEPKTDKPKTDKPKTDEPKTNSEVVSTQQKTEDTTTDTDFDIQVNEFDIAEIAEMLKDKKDELTKIEPTELFEMFGSDLMEIFSKAIASNAKKTAKK